MKELIIILIAGWIPYIIGWFIPDNLKFLPYQLVMWGALIAWQTEKYRSK